MALIKYEGFDHESGASDLYAGILSTLICVGANQTASVTLSNSTQYASGQCLAVTAVSSNNTNANAMVIMPFAPSLSTNIYTIGASVSLSASVTNGAVIGFANANVGQIYCYISAGAIKVFRGDPISGTSSQLGNTINSAVASLGWAYVEIQATIATGTSGSIIVQVNGTTVYNQTGLNTSNDGTTNVTGILLGTVNSAQSINGFTSYFDDLYALDNTGGAPYNTFLGPVRVVTQFPTANGQTTTFTGLAHHANFSNVNEIDMDADNTYNFSNQTGAVDTFTAAALPGTSSRVFAVKVTAAGRIDDSGIRTVQTYLKSGNTIVTGQSTNLVGTYQYFSDIYTADPSTSGPWSPSGVNLVQFGYKIVPSPGSPVALGSALINITFVGAANQFTTLSGLGQFTITPLIAMILPTLASMIRTIGPIVGAGTATLNTTATASASIAISGHAVLTFGLQMAGTVAIGTIKTVSQIATFTGMVGSATIIPTWTAIINQGLSAAALLTIRPAIISTLSQSVAASGSALFLITARVNAVQSSSVTGSARIGPVAAVGAISGANASNIHVGLSAWTNSHAYTAGQRVASTFNGVTNAYQANTSGTSGTTPPNGTSTSFTDGSVTWKYLSHIDFSDLQSWANSIPQTLTQPVIGLLWNNGTITTTAGTPFLTLGSTATPRVTSAVNTITLQPAPGEGIRDSLAGGSTALTFNAAKGVSFTLPSGTGGINYFDVCDGNVIINGLQFRDPNPTSGSTIIQQESSSTALTIRNCIIDGYAQTFGAAMITAGVGSFLMVNCLVVDRSSNQTNYQQAISTQSSTNRVINCTIVGLGTITAFAGAIVANSAAAVVSNTIIMGWPNGQGVAGGGGPIAPVDHCLFDVASPGTAAIDSGGNIYSKVAANQFISATADFRLKAGADALNAGATDTTDIPTADDIAGTARPQGIAWDIGAFE